MLSRDHLLTTLPLVAGACVLATGGLEGAPSQGSGGARSTATSGSTASSTGSASSTSTTSGTGTGASPPRSCDASPDCGAGGAAPTCTDGRKDGTETDIDCGGSACKPCILGKTCGAASDCQSRSCASGVCVVGIGTSCAELLKTNPGLPDGVYMLDPSGGTGDAGGPFAAYCDMTTDFGGWILMATLRTTTILITAGLSSYWAGGWSDDWFHKVHGDPTDPTASWVNQDASRFRPLITTTTILRATNPKNSVRRYHFGFGPTDWDLWNGGWDNGNISVVGPFNRSGVMVSTKPDLSSPAVANANGNWSQGVLFLGTATNSADSDDGTSSRYHVGSSNPGTFGYAGNQQVDTPWSLWIR
jgi:hypothetical protein